MSISTMYPLRRELALRSKKVSFGFFWSCIVFGGCLLALLSSLHPFYHANSLQSGGRRGVRELG